MFRITPTDGDGERTLRLEGRLVEPWVGELLSTCREAASAGCRLMLDLSGVTFVDAAGVACLRGLRGWSSTGRATATRKGRARPRFS